MQQVYRLSTVEGLFTGHRTTLNGEELALSGAQLPALLPVVETASVMHMAPLSVAFVVFPDARAPGCTEQQKPDEGQTA